MRSKNAFYNLLLYFINQILLFAFGLVYPRFIILIYGSDVNGLTATINRLLALINLVQAGAVGAAIYQMYKPVAENDYEAQSAILYSTNKFYKKVSLIYFFCAISIGIAYSFYLASNKLSVIEIFLSFVVLAINGVGSLYFTSVPDVYISPHQKRYLLTLSSLIGTIVHYFILTIVLILRLHFISIYFSILAGSIVTSLLNIYFYKRLSRGKIRKKPENKDYKIPNKKYLMISCIGENAISASPTVIITSFVGLANSSVFSIYSLIFTSMKTVLNSIQLSTSAIFGNLVKSADDNRIKNVYSCIELITLVLGTVLSSCVAALILPFIRIYTAGITDAEYYSVPLAILVVFYTCLIAFNCSFGYVSTVYGLFKYTCGATIVSSIIGIFISIICVNLLGMAYVMVGLIVAIVISTVAILICLKRKLPWFNVKKLFLRTFFMFAIVSIVMCISPFYMRNVNTWNEWIFAGVVIAFLSLAAVLVLTIVFDRDDFKRILKYVKIMLTINKE